MALSTMRGGVYISIIVPTQHFLVAHNFAATTFFFFEITIVPIKAELTFLPASYLLMAKCVGSTMQATTHTQLSS